MTTLKPGSPTSFLTPFFSSKILRRKINILGCLVVLVVISIGSIAVVHNSTSEILHRLLSSSSYEQCEVFEISLPSKPIIPVYAASYPGSGSQMTHYLFEAITGLEAGDEHLHRGDTYDMITIKTHYPARPHSVEGNRLMNRVILLIRNPLHSIPSYHNYLYEEENDIPNHTVKAPVEAWIKWRDEHVEEEIKKWKDHSSYWMSEYHTQDRLVVSYERFVDKKMGPIESTRISNFLGRQDNVNVVAPSTIPCVWDKVVNYKRVNIDEHGKELNQEEVRKLYSGSSNDQQARHLYDVNGEKVEKTNTKPIVKRRVKYVSHEDPTHPGNSKRAGNQKYDFTKSQLLEIRSMLNQLRGKYLGEYTFVVIVSGYIEEVNEELGKLEGK
mmetsp:Transcript_23333/g.28678  ORF Transcript_23333/g.28678 Transcript_23333/m.28678 type:complete len:384 (+) Transcript_23333:90-1241(+)